MPFRVSYGLPNSGSILQKGAPLNTGEATPLNYRQTDRQKMSKDINSSSFVQRLCKVIYATSLGS